MVCILIISTQVFPVQAMPWKDLQPEIRELRLKAAKSNRIPWFNSLAGQIVYGPMSKVSTLYEFLSSTQKQILKSGRIDKLYSEMEMRFSATDISNMSAPSWMVHGVQLYVIGLALAGVGIVKENAKLKNLKNEELDFASLQPQFKEAAEKIILSAELPIGMSGALATGFVLSPVVNQINQFLRSQFTGPLRAVFKEFLAQMISSFASFLGWEFAARFWHESMNMLDSQFPRPSVEEKFFLDHRNLLFGHISIVLSNPGKYSPEMVRTAKRFLNQVTENAFNILQLANLRQQWIYNTIRLKLMHGRFFAMLTSLTAANTVGTLLVPKPGLLWSSVFGLAGGVLTLYFPTEQEEAITKAIKQNTLFAIEKKQGKSSRYFLEFGFDSDGRSLKDTSLYFHHVLDKRASYRSLVLDVYIERIQEALQKISYTLGVSELATSSKDAAIDLSKQINVGNLSEALVDPIQFYITETLYLKRLIRLQTNSELKEELQDEIVNMASNVDHFCDTAVKILNAVLKYQSAESTLDISDKIVIQCGRSLSVDVSKEAAFSKPVQTGYEEAVRFINEKYNSQFNERNFSAQRFQLLKSLPQ